MQCKTLSSYINFSFLIIRVAQVRVLAEERYAIIASNHQPIKSFTVIGAFRLYDLDGDGTITKNEMLKIVKAIAAMTGQSDESFKPEVRVDKIFESMDAVCLIFPGSGSSEYTM